MHLHVVVLQVLPGQSAGPRQNPGFSDVELHAAHASATASAIHGART
jgi:hypothetical protein